MNRDRIRDLAACSSALRTAPLRPMRQWPADLAEAAAPLAGRGGQAVIELLGQGPERVAGA